MSACNEHTTFDFELVLLALLLFLLVTIAITIHLRSLIVIHEATVVLMTFLRVFRL